MMSAQINKIAPNDNKQVNDIVDKLKKQGLFDQFRKECLADVDTKPAYLNLRHRVENAVNRFLSVYKWHPDLNKNLIRESLRKHINESQMLATGVDHIIEQVVNPKVQNVFKPAIDHAVCEFLGIDPELWKERQRLKEEMKRREERGEDIHMMTGGPFGRGIPNLMDLPVNTNTPGDPNAMNNVNSIHNLHFQQQQQQQPQQPQSQQPFQTDPFGNFVQQPFNLPGYPNQFPNIMPAYPGQPPLPGQPGLPPFGIPGPDGTLPVPSVPGQTTDPTQQEAPPEGTIEQDKEKKKKKKLEPLTVEDLLNIPLPKDETKTKKRSKKDEDLLGVNENSVGAGEFSQVEETVVVDTFEATEESVVTEGEYSQDEQMITDGFQTEVVETSENQLEPDGQPKVYHFAWQGLNIDEEIHPGYNQQIQPHYPNYYY